MHNFNTAWYYSYTRLQYIRTNDQVCFYERPITDPVKHTEADMRLWDYQEGLRVVWVCNYLQAPHSTGSVILSPCGCNSDVQLVKVNVFNQDLSPPPNPSTSPLLSPPYPLISETRDLPALAENASQNPANPTSR